MQSRARKPNIASAEIDNAQIAEWLAAGKIPERPDCEFYDEGKTFELGSSLK